MKKSLYLLFVLIVACACTMSSIFAEEAVTLRVFNYLDMSSPNAQVQNERIWDAFEKANPNIKIERENYFNEPFFQKLEAYIASGQFPDVVYMWPGGRSTSIHKQHLVKDLKPFLGNTAKEFSAAALAPQSGNYLGEIPITVTVSHVLYVNQKMLASMNLSVPKTYAQLKAMSKKLKAAGKSTVLMGAQDGWVQQSCIFSMIAGRICGDDYLNRILAGEAKFTDAPFLNALKFFNQLFKDGVLDKRNVQTPYNDVNGLWASGKAPFMVDGDWKVNNFLTDPSTKQALIPVSEQKNYCMTIFPSIPGEKFHHTTSVVAGAGYGMSAKIAAGSAKEKAAWKLIMWLVSPEVEKIRLEIGQAIPNRKGVTSDKLEPLVRELVRFSNSIKGGTAVLDNALDASIYTPLNTGLQEIGLGLATPEQVAEKLQKACDSWRTAQK